MCHCQTQTASADMSTFSNVSELGGQIALCGGASNKDAILCHIRY